MRVTKKRVVKTLAFVGVGFVVAVKTDNNLYIIGYAFVFGFLSSLIIDRADWLIKNKDAKNKLYELKKEYDLE